MPRRSKFVKEFRRKYWRSIYRSKFQILKRKFIRIFYKQYKTEIGAVLEEFDIDKYERTIWEDGFEEGREEGRKLANRLTQILIEQNRIEDLKRFTYDLEYRKALYREFRM